MSLLYRLIIIVLVQTLVLCTIIGFRQWTLNTGKKIILETAPVDPRSLFSGDYVILNYKISAIPFFANPQSLRNNQTVYIVLAPPLGEKPYWIAESASFTEPKVAVPKIFIKGRVHGISKNSAFIRYGIESYFVPEGEGKKLQIPGLQDVISVKVAVDRFGNAAIDGILVNGEEVYQEKLF